MKNVYLLTLLTFMSVPALAAMHEDHSLSKQPKSQSETHQEHSHMTTTDTSHTETPSMNSSHSTESSTISGMDFMHHQNDQGTMPPSDQAYTHINHTMHEAMSIDFTGDPDIDFLMGMIPHHQGAVDMAKVQLKYGQDGTLKRFTQRVIREQAREIRFMKINLETLMAERGENINPNPQAIRAYEIVNENMHREMNMALSGQADKDFVKGMIPHHEGAVAMAKVVLEYGTDPNARRLAYDIINAQEAEIYWMKQWLARQRLMQARY